MQFSTLSDPVHVARALAAFELAWGKVQSSSGCRRWGDVAAKERLYLIIEGYACVADDEQDLAKRAIERLFKFPRHA